MLIPFSEIVKKYGKVRNVLHVGASTGQEAKDYAKGGVHHVTWIEAIPSVYEQLCKNIKPYKNMFAVNACVADVACLQVEFKITNNEAQSSSFLELGIHKKEHPDVIVVDSMTLETDTISGLIMKGKIMSAESFDFLNLDIQGAELLALKGYKEFLRDVKIIYCEVNKAKVYEECPLIEDIDRFLESFGFIRKETKWCGNFSWGDAIYIKK